MIKNLVSRLTEKVVSSKGPNVIMRYSRDGKDGEASGYLHVFASMCDFVLILLLLCFFGIV